MNVTELLLLLRMTGHRGWVQDQGGDCPGRAPRVRPQLPTLPLRLIAVTAFDSSLEQCSCGPNTVGRICTVGCALADSGTPLRMGKRRVDTPEQLDDLNRILAEQAAAGKK